MKYYCRNCGSEITSGIEFPVCPICLNRTILTSAPQLLDSQLLEQHANDLVEIPTYETVGQWEKRTRRKYPNSALVYARDYGRWHPYTWLMCDFAYPNRYIVATDAGAPPDDWEYKEPVNCIVEGGNICATMC